MLPQRHLPWESQSMPHSTDTIIITWNYLYIILMSLSIIPTRMLRLWKQETSLSLSLMVSCLNILTMPPIMKNWHSNLISVSLAEWAWGNCLNFLLESECICQMRTMPSAHLTRINRTLYVPEIGIHVYLQDCNKLMLRLFPGCWQRFPIFVRKIAHAFYDGRQGFHRLVSAPCLLSKSHRQPH